MTELVESEHRFLFETDKKSPLFHLGLIIQRERYSPNSQTQLNHAALVEKLGLIKPRGGVVNMWFDEEVILELVRNSSTVPGATMKEIMEARHQGMVLI